jgi:hypothetical protein
MFLSFYENKELDQINYELPIDFLSFVRYFTYDILTKQINRFPRSQYTFTLKIHT